jgi:hypothetical protein
MAGALFTANCLIIACWERDLDLSQRFDSWVTRSASALKWLPVALVVQMVMSVVMSVLGWLPPLLAVSLIVSDVLLLVLTLRRDGYHRLDAGSNSKIAPVSLCGLLADAALVAPPAILTLLTAAIG